MAGNRKWTTKEYEGIIDALANNERVIVKKRKEYTLLKEVLRDGTYTEEQNSGKARIEEKADKMQAGRCGVISPIPRGIPSNDTDTSLADYRKPFLAPLDVQEGCHISDRIASFKVIQSDKMSLNVGFDTEFQEYIDEKGPHRLVLSLQMSINVGNSLIRYFFLVRPSYQEVTAAGGGMIPAKYCLTDILDDLRRCYYPSFPLVPKKSIRYKEKPYKNTSFKVVDYKSMKDSIIPVTLICHAGKADVSVFRRSKYDVDLVKRITEIQGGWMTTEDVLIKAENDRYYNNYWLIELSIRDTLGLTPADNKSLKSLGAIIDRPKIDLPSGAIENMTDYALSHPTSYYEYSMNDADIVVLFCTELFLCNHAVPMTLSSAAASSMCGSIKEYFGVKRKADYDRIYRGLELLDEGLVPSKNECLGYLRATRYVPIRDNPDARMISEFFEESYTGGFNASFYIGWITEQTIDLDLQNAYPTAMACIVDIDWEQNVRDFPRNYEITLQDLVNPLIPAAAVGDFDFPDDCYCPNIPVPVKGGMKIYPRHGRNVYMTGPDMYLALQLGARIKVFRGFTCQMLKKDGKNSKCLAHAVTILVQDRITAKRLYHDKPMVEKSLKAMVNSCYGKTAQNVSPKTRYNARTMGRVSAEPSCVTSPYHAAYITALVRCMLIACINQLHDMGYRVYSVTTDGFITNAPTEVVRGLDAYGFTEIFQNGRYTLNQTTENCDANHIWEPKHYNETFLNITTRGNVAVNDEGVLAHNSYTTGEVKDSRADRDAYIIAVLSRTGRLKCSTKVWTQFSEIVERRHDFHVAETIRQLSMNFDYKRCPVIETAADTPVHYESASGCCVDAVIAEFDTRPFDSPEEFLSYRKTMQNEDCVKTTADLIRVKTKSSVKTKGYIGKDLDKKILMSILMGYRAGLYQIPALDGLKQSEILKVVNGWGISKITLNDWKNCSRADRQEKMLPWELIRETYKKIIKQ